MLFSLAVTFGGACRLELLTANAACLSRQTFHSATNPPELVAAGDERLSRWTMIPAAVDKRSTDESASSEAEGLAQELAALRRRIRSALQDQERKRLRLRSRAGPPGQEIQELTGLDRTLAEAQRALEEWRGRQEEIGG